MTEPYPISPEDRAEIERRILADQPCDDAGERRDGGYKRPAWTPRAFSLRGDRFILACSACGHEGEAPLQQLIDSGRGDWVWARFTGTWRCVCGSKDVEIRLDLAKDRTR